MYFNINFVRKVGIVWFVSVFLVTSSFARKCERCILSQDCKVFVEMTRGQQTRWIQEYNCDNYKIEDDYSTLFGFAPYAKGDYVCCPEQRRETPHDVAGEHRNTNRRNHRPDKRNNPNRRRPVIKSTTQNPINNDWNQDPRLEVPIYAGNLNTEATQRPWDSNLRQEYPRQPDQNFNNANPNRRNDGQNGGTFGQSNNQRPNVWDPSMRPSTPNNNFKPDRPQYPVNNQWQTQNPNLNNNFGQPLYKIGNVNSGRNYQDPSSMFSSPQFPLGQPQLNLNPGFGIPQSFVTSSPYPQTGISNGSNPYFQGNTFQDQGPQQIQPGFGSNVNMQVQCSARITTLPDYKSGCCGRDYAGDDRIIGQDNRAQSIGMPPQNGIFPNFPLGNKFLPPIGFTRFARSVENNSVVVDNRIIGGKATEIEEFPWTVLLVATFTDGYQDSSFNCGGSLISDRYVLTAAHCVKESESRLKEVEATLAEYDKRTFPNDCVNSLSEGRKCIKNIRMAAEDVIAHPYFDESRLQNDIALIRLQGKAPYTENIRPICLPPINIDSSDLKNLPVSVAGWGRNGRFASNVKQSTVVHLVPQRECRSSPSSLCSLKTSTAEYYANNDIHNERFCVLAYPGLTNRHLCAAGYTGEDTCKGDSGGPLMMFYQGTYFVSGIVSGKRADSPCGTSVPSLYTNVYHYLDWITENMRN